MQGKWDRGKIYKLIFSKSTTYLYKSELSRQFKSVLFFIFSDIHILCPAMWCYNKHLVKQGLCQDSEVATVYKS